MYLREPSCPTPKIETYRRDAPIVLVARIFSQNCIKSIFVKLKPQARRWSSGVGHCCALRCVCSHRVHPLYQIWVGAAWPTAHRHRRPICNRHGSSSVTNTKVMGWGHGGSIGRASAWRSNRFHTCLYNRSLCGTSLFGLMSLITVESPSNSDEVLNGTEMLSRIWSEEGLSFVSWEALVYSIDLEYTGESLTDLCSLTCFLALANVIKDISLIWTMSVNKSIVYCDSIAIVQFICWFWCCRFVFGVCGISDLDLESMISSPSPPPLTVSQGV